MNRYITLLVIGLIALHAQEQAPVSSSTVEGKIVYIPIIKPVNFNEEAQIQKEDQNITKLGGAK